MERSVEGLLYFFSFVFVPFDLFVGEEFVLTCVFFLQLFYYKRMRWQLVPLYFALSLATIVFLYQTLFSYSKPSRYLIWIETALIIVSFIANLILPDIVLPKAKGLTTGTLTTTISRVRVKFWYPAERVEGFKKAPLVPSPLAAGFIQGGLSKKAPGFLLSHLESTPSNSYERAHISTKQDKWPLVILSHGFYGIPEIYTIIGERLASQGYIVCAPEHTDGSCPHNLVTLPTGFNKDDEDQVRTFCSNLLKIRMQDLDHILNSILGDETTDYEFVRERINLDKIAGYGHSYGGCTIIKLLKENPLVKCGIALDAWVAPLSYEELDKKCDKSIFYIQSEHNVSSTFEVAHPKWVNAVCRSFSGVGLFTLVGSLHHNFNDLSLYSPCLSYVLRKLELIGSINCAYALEVCLETSLKFFQHELLDETPIAASELLMFPELIPEKLFK